MNAFLTSFGQFFYSLFNQIFAVFANIRFFDIIDILLVTFIIYKGIELFRETRAKQLIKGIIVLFAVWILAQWFDLISIKWLLVKVVDYAIIAVAIIFQPELRRALERVGRSKLKNLGFGQTGEGELEVTIRCIDAVCKASGQMQDQKIGALIVFEQSTLLGEIINTGTTMDAAASTDLICNVFFPKSPLHDGGMVIRDGRICAAGCILPLTANQDLSKELGTRHRAAIGMSENSDAVVVIVSEETGNISVAVNGVITRNYNAVTLRNVLNEHLIEHKTEKRPGVINRIFGKKTRFKEKEDKD